MWIQVPWKDVKVCGYSDPLKKKKNLNQSSLTPRWHLTPSLLRSHVLLYLRTIQFPWKYIQVCGYSDPFFKDFNQRSLTARWPLTPRLLRPHVWVYPKIIVFKSHGNTSMYVNTVINFAKFHILYTNILHTYYIQNEWPHSLFLNTVQMRQKITYAPYSKWSKKLKNCVTI